MSATLLIVEDHPTVRETLADLVIDALPEATVLQAENISAAADVLVNGEQVNLVILDLSLPDTQGLMALVDVRMLEPAAKILVVSGHDMDRTIELAFMLGANGFLSKASPCEAIIDAIVGLARGYSPKEAKPVANGHAPKTNGHAPTTNGHAPSTNGYAAKANGHSPNGAKPNGNGHEVGGLVLPETGQIKLTKQETRILSMLCKGHMNKILAYETGLTESTIKAHISSILRKFDVPSRTQAILEIINPFHDSRY